MICTLDSQSSKDIQYRWASTDGYRVGPVISLPNGQWTLYHSCFPFPIPLLSAPFYLPSLPTKTYGPVRSFAVNKNLCPIDPFQAALSVCSYLFSKMVSLLLVFFFCRLLLSSAAWLRRYSNLLLRSNACEGYCGTVPSPTLKSSPTYLSYIFGPLPPP